MHDCMTAHMVDRGLAGRNSSVGSYTGVSKTLTATLIYSLENNPIPVDVKYLVAAVSRTTEGVSGSGWH